jgi:hypothetical protein
MKRKWLLRFLEKSSKRIVHLTTLIILLFGFSPLFGQDAPKLVSRSFTQAAMRTAVEYWTPERMQNAIPMDLGSVDPNGPSAKATTPERSEPEVKVPGQPPPLGNSLGQTAHPRADAGILAEYPYPFDRFPVDPSVYGMYPYSTVGKVFFTLDGGDFVCSASVIDPGHLLLTARHCMYDIDTGSFATNWAFYPGYFQGPGFLGAWPARILVTWGSGPNWRYDIGIVQLFDDDAVGCGGSSGSPIWFYTGYLGYAWNTDYLTGYWEQFGYPQAPPFDGQSMFEVSSGFGAENVFGLDQTIDTVEVGNDMTGGSSGGPWILDFGVGNYTNGVNSFKFLAAHPDAMNSPKFLGYNFGDLIAAAIAQPCP